MTKGEAMTTRRPRPVKLTRDQIGHMPTDEIVEYMARVRDLPEVGAPVLRRAEEIGALAKREAALLEQARLLRVEMRQKAIALMRTIRQEGWTARELDSVGLEHIE